MKWQVLFLLFLSFLSAWGFLMSINPPSPEPYRSSEHGSLHSSVPQRPDPDLALFRRLSGQRGTGQPCAISKCLHAALQPQALSKAKDQWTLRSPTSRLNPWGDWVSTSFLSFIDTFLKTVHCELSSGRKHLWLFSTPVLSNINCIKL